MKYTPIFLDKKQNSERHLMDDCLRCHGMHYAGAIRDLVTPVDSTVSHALIESLTNEVTVRSRERTDAAFTIRPLSIEAAIRVLRDERRAHVDAAEAKAKARAANLL